MNVNCEIKDLTAWPDGALKIEWVRHHMPLLRGLEAEFRAERPFAGLKVALSVHLEAKTAYLCRVLAAGGAEMYITGSNPLSTQDDVAAALVHDGLHVFAWHDAAPQEYEAHIRRVLEIGPNVIIDDGGDLVSLMHEEFRALLPGVIGGCEETTTGILRLRAHPEQKRPGGLPDNDGKNRGGLLVFRQDYPSGAAGTAGASGRFIKKRF